ncbi:hypothetical protein [Rhizobium laguerreae]|uniref:hypothetical protein n=1 Tax=Rhizobium laguerreae TaxID=1076926 RepID=UPI001A8C0505|nr:hypothetical protein [Rhizobium laguerreae]MBN9987147.1 hypothetical protein [Rhizobium laguerreae]MBY3537911.1 hypothetical protein [Rhizobium laguerreae]MBY3551456.1 hypothetical protein [Rhizobium laguerreae]
MNAVQVWNPDDWELFSLNLLQTRHGALNVHKIPAAHQGDFGIDYYCTKEAVAYQCYAVEEPIDISTRADRQKTKITRDLAKIVANESQVGALFNEVKIKHWILLAPLHDSKEVNLHCSKKTKDMREKKCGALDETFEVAIHDLALFPAAVIANGLTSISRVKLSVPEPTIEEVQAWTAGSSNLLANAHHKLSKRSSPENVGEAVSDATSAFLQGNALLDALRNGSPDLHEKVTIAIKSRARRLQFAGPQGGQDASGILHAELDSLISAVQSAAPNLSIENAEQIAYGAISEWIMRCPLDFPNA